MARVPKYKKIEEMVKCSASAEYYLTNYGYVYHPKRGHIRFRLFDYQKEALNSYQDNRFNITLKSRQTGFSTLTAGFIAWMIIFHKAREIVVVANKQDNAQNFIRKIRTFIKKSPFWMVPEITSDNKKSIELSNGSKVSAQATTGDAGRSESLSLLVIDEAAMIDSNKVDDLWAAAFPTLSLGGSAVIISTPKGVGNFYHKQWLSAINKESDFVPLVAHWTEHPVYGAQTVWQCENCEHEQDHGNANPLKEVVLCDNCGEDYLVPTSPWYEQQKKQLGDPRKVAQELDMDFLGSGDQVLSEEYIKEAEKSCRPPLRIEGFDNNLWVWSDPQPDREYLISADVARGDGTDYSACHVIDLKDNEQVAEYKGKLPPDLFSQLLMELGYRYNEALLVPEANSIGYATCLKIQEEEYPNLHYSFKGVQNVNNRKKMERIFAKADQTVPGFQTTVKTRTLVVAQLEQDIRTSNIKLRSTRTISELRTFIYRNGRPEAMHSYNDDLTMALAIGLYVKATSLNSMLSAKNMIISSINSISNEAYLATEKIKDLNKAFYKNSSEQNPWKMNTSYGQHDLTWLVGKRK